MAKVSPLSLLLCAFFLFSANVLALSAVLGVDLGTEYIKAALVKPGIPLEIVLTKDSRRKEVSAVAFKPPQNGAKPGSYPERAYGSDAMALFPRFPGDVYPNLKTLLGLPADNSIVKEYAERHPALQLEAHKLRNTAAFKSKDAFAPEEEAWMVEELLAMELQSIRRNAEALAGSDVTVRSVVITIPSFYTLEEKRAIELAADLAGLHVLSLISDGLAVGLNYATSRQFPNIVDGAKPEYHMVFDMGAGSTKATVMKFQSRTVKDIGKFNKTIQEVQVLGSGWDRGLGGDTLNSLIVDDMVAQFVETAGAKRVSAAVEGVKAHGRAIAKLTKEAERLRHVLSANTNTAASFEGLYEDVDFKYKISRAGFEKMVEVHAGRVATAIQNALEMAGLKESDLDSVILHGGATRTPFVQKQLETIFGGSEKLRSNVNADEAAVFGTGFRAAELSPSFRVKEIKISDGSVYPAGIKWSNQKGKTQHQRLWTSTSHLGAAPKEITFANKEDFTIDFYQQVSASGVASTDDEERPTRALTTKNLTATIAMLGEKYSCDPSAIQFKVAMRLSSENGEVEISKATAECEAEEPEKEGIIDGVKNLFGFGKKDQEPLKDGESSGAEAESTASSSTTDSSTTSESSSSTTSTTSASASESTDNTKPKQKLTVAIPIKYEVERTGTPQLSKADILALKDRLKAFETSDRSRRLREETLNQLESLAYKVRDLLDSNIFAAASTKEERDKLETKSSETRDWLYGEGAEASRDDLKAKITELQNIVTPVQARIEESAKRPDLVKGLKEALSQTNEFIKTIKDQIAEYEAFHSSVSASPSTSEASSTTTAPPSQDDFAGLEDDDASSATKEPDMEDATKERGPVPPLYKLEDLKESEGLFKSVSAWLDEKETAQAKLGPADDPVLTVKDLTTKREKLDKAGMDLAMKSIRNFESSQKKTKSKSKSKSKPKTKKAKKAKTGEPPAGQTNDATKGGRPSMEELEELIKKAKAEKQEATKDDTRKHEEL